MSKIFTTLSDNQREAIGKPCAVIGCTGIYRERSGRFGPWVQCDNQSAYTDRAHKVERPRGRHVTETTTQHIDTETSTETPIADGEIIKPETKETTEVTNVQPGSLEATIIAIVKPTIDASLAKVKIDAAQVTAEVERATKSIISDIKEQLALLKAAQPITIEIKRVDGTKHEIKGAHYLMPRLLNLLAAGFHVYLWGPPGSGKSTAQLQAAEALGLRAEVDTLDPTTTRSMIQGWKDPVGNRVLTSFGRCFTTPKSAYIAEEIDLGPAGVQSLKNSALANGHTNIAGESVARAAESYYMANGNTPGMPTNAFPDRKPMSNAFKDRLYFMYWPVDRNVMRRACGMAEKPAPERKLATCTPQEWGAFVERLMDWGPAHEPTLYISPRAAIEGVKAIAAGETPEEMADGLIFKGCKDEIKRKALEACKLPGVK